MQVNFVAPSQHESLIDLLCELHAYYNDKTTISRDVVRAHLLENLLAVGSPLRLVVATRADGAVMGFAAISLTFSLVDPAPETRTHCQLKELFVRSTERSAGVGKALMAAVARYAMEHGCRRIDWPVKATNQAGIKFYKELGAEQVPERLSYRLVEPHLTRLAHQSVHCLLVPDLLKPTDFTFRIASTPDAVTVSALTIQVYLHTYATEGIRPDIAREAHSAYSVDAFARRLAEPQRRFILAEAGDGLLGFAEVLLTSVPSPAEGFTGAELVRLYVQPAAQRVGLGRALLARAEQLVHIAHIPLLWLRAWEGNHNARAFYARLGYEDVGATTYSFQGHTVPNRVFAKRLELDVRAVVLGS
jgi:ribosomal protein S18 acetylase RimI-like enzyme